MVSVKVEGGKQMSYLWILAWAIPSAIASFYGFSLDDDDEGAAFALLGIIPIVGMITAGYIVTKLITRTKNEKK